MVKPFLHRCWATSVKGSNMPRVVTCLLINEEAELLILKRSDKVKTYRGLWGGVAGYVEPGEKPYETALKEIQEEVGIKKEYVVLINQGDIVKFTDVYEEEQYEWAIYPFVFKIRKNKKIQIDWEHSEYRWITPSEITRYDTVPHLKQMVLNLLS